MAFHRDKLTTFAWPGPQSALQNQRAFFDFFRAQLGNPTEDEWYQVRKPDFKVAGGLSMLNNYFNGSPFQFLRAMLPDVAWRAWSFGSVPDAFWDTTANRSAYMKFLGERLKITKPEEWYDVTARQFRANDGGGLLLHFRNSPVLAIVDHMPDYPWKPEQFVKGKKTQKRLYSLVCRLFCPENEEIKLTIYDVEFDHKHENLLFAGSGRPMEIDVYVPAIQLAFEYQGEQHYFAIECWGGEEALKKVQARDQEKFERCRRANITLIRIPYTWTGDGAGFMHYLREGLRERDEARRKAAQRVPRVLIMPKRRTEAQEGPEAESGGREPQGEQEPQAGSESQDGATPS